MSGARPLVIGVGNDWRGDDAVGLVVARRLRLTLGGRADVVECTGDLSRLLPLWEGRPCVVLVDAMAGGRAGQVQRLQVPSPSPHGAAPLSPPGSPTLASTATGPSSHALGVAGALALGAALGMHPARLTIYGIAGAAWTMGAGLSAPVDAAVAALCARIEDELAPFLVPPSPAADAAGSRDVSGSPGA